MEAQSPPFLAFPSAVRGVERQDYCECVDQDSQDLHLSTPTLGRKAFFYFYFFMKVFASKKIHCCGKKRTVLIFHVHVHVQ